jgi:hypothetical protein
VFVLEFGFRGGILAIVMKSKSDVHVDDFPTFREALHDWWLTSNEFSELASVWTQKLHRLPLKDRGSSKSRHSDRQLISQSFH